MKLNLDRYVPGLLLWLSNKMASSASSLYRTHFDLGVADWRVLSYFEIHSWSTASSACDLMGLDKAAVSRSVALLQERGFLKSRPLGLRKIAHRKADNPYPLYPWLPFWELVAEEGADVIVNSDAHRPQDLQSRTAEAHGIVAQLGLRHVEPARIGTRRR